MLGNYSHNIYSGIIYANPSSVVLAVFFIDHVSSIPQPAIGLRPTAAGTAIAGHLAVFPRRDGGSERQPNMRAWIPSHVHCRLGG